MKKVFNILVIAILSLFISTNVYAEVKWSGTCQCLDEIGIQSASCADNQQSCASICNNMAAKVYKDSCTSTNTDSDGAGRFGTTGNNSNNTGGGVSEGTSVDCGAFSEITRPAAKLIMIAAPIILLILGTVDFLKAVAASDEKEMKKAISTFIKRTIICVIIILLPVIVNMIMSWTAYGDLTSCF